MLFQQTTYSGTLVVYLHVCSGACMKWLHTAHHYNAGLPLVLIRACSWKSHASTALCSGSPLCSMMQQMARSSKQHMMHGTLVRFICMNMAVCSGTCMQWLHTAHHYN